MAPTDADVGRLERAIAELVLLSGDTRRVTSRYRKSLPNLAAIVALHAPNIVAEAEAAERPKDDQRNV